MVVPIREKILLLCNDNSFDFHHLWNLIVIVGHVPFEVIHFQHYYFPAARKDPK